MSGHLEPRFVELPGGVRLEYVEVGGGLPVVYFHGAGGVFRHAAFLPALGQHFRVLAPSRPGYDHSSGACAAAHEEATVMRTFIREVVGGPVHLIAESAGAAAGCWLSLMDPPLISSLVLAAPTGFVSAPHSPPPASAESLEVRLFGSQPAWSEPPTADDELARQRNAAAHRARVRAEDEHAELVERLPEISTPTLILCGTADQIAGPEVGQLLVQRIPNSNRVFVYNAAHSLPVAACRPFVQLSTDFIKRGERFVVAQPS